MITINDILQNNAFIYFTLKKIYTCGYSTILMSNVLSIIPTLNLEIGFNRIGEKGVKDMTQQALETLIRVYNTLLLINTKGEDTMLMGDCLKVMKQELEAIQVALAEDSQVSIEDIEK